MSVPMSLPILIVDDYNVMVRIVRNLLGQLGFSNVDEASHGKTALQKLRARKYGLVISDLTMRPMSGADLLREVRADEKLKDTPVLMMTPAEGNRVSCEGATCLLPKPFDASMLKQRLAAALGVAF